MKQPTLRRQLSLRTTQLLLLVAIILTAIVLNMVTLHQTRRYFNVFDRNLLGYYTIQRLQSAIDTNRSMLSQYLRSQQTDHLRNFSSSRTQIKILQHEVQNGDHTTMEADFEIRAINRGLSAYFDYADQAIAGVREGVGADFGAFVRAERISDYVFTYIQRLMRVRLSKELETHQQLRSHARLTGLGAQLGLLTVGILMTLFAAVFARRITIPIRRLADSAYDMAHGNLDGKKVDVTAHRFSVTEINVLCESFNLMQYNIRELVADLKDKAAVERQLHHQELKTLHTEHLLEAARLQGLQAQMNPHFLFNALNTISRVGLFEGAKDTTALIHSLSNLLRYHLNTRDAVVQLEHELRMVQEYVHIQETRFRNRLRFELDCNVDAEQVYVPCFSIQPLVENAVQYGIEPLETGGVVRVLIRDSDSRVRIAVEDSGVGMSDTKISEILQQGGQTQTETTAGIGLRNVIDRLHLLYHGKATLSIERGSLGGTTVIMDIPENPPQSSALLQRDVASIPSEEEDHDDV
ncbi:MAG: histidine kinase [Spirochaetia bacterium]